MNTRVLHFHSAVLTALALSLLCVLPHAAYAAQSTVENKSIQHLIDQVAHSEFVFIRNAKTYTGAEAAEHMMSKYEHFKDEITTAEEFIDKCASKSLLSGKPYLVINKQGEKIRTRDWLMSELQVYRTRQTGVTPE